MYLLVNLIGALLWSKVECEASDLELVCPQGWIANDVAEYSCIFHSETGSKLPGSDGFSVCLTCHWSSTPADRFGNVEVCVITGPSVALRMNSMKFFCEFFAFFVVTEVDFRSGLGKLISIFATSVANLLKFL